MTGKLNNDLQNIENHFKNYRDDKTTNERQDLLLNILNHALNTVPFYKDLDRVPDIQSFPIVNKNIINENRDLFLSSSFDINKLSKTTTSGSTGTPFTVFKDKRKLARHKAENIFFTELCGSDIGEVLYYLRVWNNVNKKSRIEQFLMNIKPVEISNLSEDTIENLLKKISIEKGQKSMLGFGSSLEEIARYIKRRYPNEKMVGNSLNAIQVMSETISDDAINTLEQYFKCKVLSRYSNMENGFIAHQVPNKGASYQINHGSFLVEILKLHEDKPVNENEIGRIVVTDFFNYGMPLIRYDTGDLASFEMKGDQGMVLNNIEGRVVDSIYNTKGELLSPHSITNLMWNYADIRQFQFIQKGKKVYKILLNAEEPYHKVEDMIADIKKYLGSDAEVIIEYVHEIPLLLSGKRKKVKHAYNQNEK